MKKTITGVSRPYRYKKVICVETGIVYESVKSVEEITGINRASISMVLNGRRNKAGGYHWKLVDSKGGGVYAKATS